MKEIKKINMFCSICESIHDISLMEEERETIIKGEKIKYKELYYKCPKYQNNNIFINHIFNMCIYFIISFNFIFILF